MTAHDPSQNKPPKAYAVGYGKPPKSGQFQPGQRANPHGRPKGQPTLQQIMLEDAARIVKMRVGDEIEYAPRLRALVRKLGDLGLQENLPAARLYLAMFVQSQSTEEVAPQAEEPLTAEELEALMMMRKTDGN